MKTAGVVFALWAASLTAADGPAAWLQGAIDAKSAAGGGRVTIEAGEHRFVGTLYLRNDVELHLEKGATLVGSDDWRSYDDVDDGAIGKRPENSRKVFIVAHGCRNVAITGEGVIDGRGPSFYDTNIVKGVSFYAKPAHPRPRMLQFFDCKGVRLEDVTLKDSPGWTCWVRECEDFSAARVKIHADQKMLNNDGFHVDGSRHVRIGDCDFRTGDDCVVMRANRAEGKSLTCEDMVVSNCVMNSSCQCIRLSCPSDDTIRNGRFFNLRMKGGNGIVSVHPAHYVAPWDEGFAKMDDIVIENCEIEARRNPILFTVDPGIKLREFGNVVFRNVQVRGGRPIRLSGTEDAKLRNVTLENVEGVIGDRKPLDVGGVENLVLKNVKVASGGGVSRKFERPMPPRSWEAMRPEELIGEVPK